MTETGWQAIGRIARSRRERLGLKQEDLADYGGPGVSTVGKFERAAQESFPLRTQQQMEKALGWSRTIVEQVVSSIDEGTLTAEEWEHDLIEEDVPDLSGTQAKPPAVTDDEQLAAFIAVWRLIDADRRDEALRAAVLAIVPMLTAQGFEQLEASQPAGDVLGEGGDGDADDTGSSAASQVPEVRPAKKLTKAQQAEVDRAKRTLTRGQRDMNAQRGVKPKDGASARTRRSQSDAG